MSRERMKSMSKCKYCGRLLDPGEPCDCQKEVTVVSEEVAKEELKLEVVPFEPIKEIQFNKAELEEKLKAYLSKYDGIVITSDMISDMKKEKAKLNKLTKAINDERIRQKKAFAEPITAFENDVKSLVALIDTTVKNIDFQIKAYDEKDKAEKLEKLRAFFDEKITDELREKGVTFDKIFREHWNNKSESLKACQNDIEGIIFTITKELELISKQCEEFYLECETKYFEDLKLIDALEHGAILKKKKEALEKLAAEKEAEQQKVQEPTPTPIEDVKFDSEYELLGIIKPEKKLEKKTEKHYDFSFRVVNVGVSDLNWLKACMDSKGIEYEIISYAERR